MAVLRFRLKFRLPVFRDQPTQYYFMPGLKIDVLALVDDVNGHETNLLLPEGQWPACKDVNGVASTWFHRFQSHQPTLCAHKLIHHTDNCTGQLNNHWIVPFLSYLLITSQQMDPLSS